MATYRLFFIGHDQHIIRADAVTCATDDDALTAALHYRNDYRAVEVWELGRLVHRVDGVADAGLDV